MRQNFLIIIAAILVCITVIGFSVFFAGDLFKSNNTTNDTNGTNNTTMSVNNTTNNTSVNNTTNTSAKKSAKTSSKKSSSKSSSNDGYHYSAQYGEEIKEWTDSDGVQHIRSKSGKTGGDYNPNTGKLVEWGEDGYYSN